jgi:hypothetical protein
MLEGRKMDLFDSKKEPVAGYKISDTREHPKYSGLVPLSIQQLW